MYLFKKLNLCETRKEKYWDGVRTLLNQHLLNGAHCAGWGAGVQQQTTRRVETEVCYSQVLDEVQASLEGPYGEVKQGAYRFWTWGTCVY